MHAVIYVCDNIEIPIYEQWNRCAQYAKRYGYSIADKVLDFEGGHFYQAVDKAIFNNDIDCVIVYHKSCIGNFEDVLFFRIYLNEFGKKLIFCN